MERLKEEVTIFRITVNIINTPILTKEGVWFNSPTLYNGTLG
jgi:hypothetical protein